MVNVLALGLILSSLAAASVWCPPLEKQQQKEREAVVVKEGHRVIVKEHEKEGFHSVLTQETLATSEKSSRIDSAKEENCVKDFAGKKVDVIIEEAKEKYTEAASVLPNIGQGISTSTAKASGKSSKEIVCDGDGVCREKVSGVFGDIEEKMAEKITQVDKAAKDAVETVVHNGENLVEKAEGFVERVVDKMKRTGQDMAGKVKEAGEGFGKTAREKTQIAVETVVHSGLVERVMDKMKRSGQDMAGKVKEAGEGFGKTAREKTQIAVETVVHSGLVEGVVDKMKRSGQDMAGKVKEAGEGFGKTAREKTHIAVETVVHRDLVERVVDKMKRSGQDMAGKVKQAGEGLGKTAREKIQIAVETVVHSSLVERVVDKMKRSGQDMAGKMKEAGEGFGKTAREKTQIAVETVVRSGLVVRLVDKMKRTGQDMAGKVKEAYEGFGKTAREKTQIAEYLVEKRERTGEDLAEKAKKAGEGFRKTAREKTQIAEDLAGKEKRTREDLAEKARKAGETLVEKANRTGEEMTQKVTHAAQAVGREGRKNLTEILQEVRDVDAGMYAISLESLSSLAAILHLLAFSSTYGMCGWLTFGLSYVLARALPRQQLGFVQSKIYPVYFRVIMYGIGSSLLTHLFIHGWLSPASSSDLLEAHCLLSCLVLVLMNMFYIEPLVNKIALECLKIEKEEGRGFEIAALVEPRIPATVTTTTTATAVDGGSSPIATDGSPVMTETSAKTEPATRIQGEKLRLVGLSKRLKSLDSYSSSLNMAVLMGLTWHLVYLAQSLQVRC